MIHYLPRLDRLLGLFTLAGTRLFFPVASQHPRRPREASNPQPHNDRVVTAQPSCFSQDRNNHAQTYRKPIEVFFEQALGLPRPDL